MKDSVFNTYKIAIILCILCSVSVSSIYVVLKPQQDKNKALDKKKKCFTCSRLDCRK